MSKQLNIFIGEIFTPHIHTSGQSLAERFSSHRPTDVVAERGRGWAWVAADAGCEDYSQSRGPAELHCIMPYWYRPEETRQPAMRWEGADGDAARYHLAAQ